MIGLLNSVFLEWREWKQFKVQGSGLPGRGLCLHRTKVWHRLKTRYKIPGQNFLIKDLPAVLILIADQILNDRWVILTNKPMFN